VEGIAPRAPGRGKPGADNPRVHGLHLTADLRGCAADRAVMVGTDALRDACLGAVEQAGLTAVGELFHRFAPAAQLGDAAPSGITGVVLLAESHLAVHTWPELGAATLDVYVCNLGADNSARAEALLGALLAAFRPSAIERHSLERGREPLPQA
jgi:S-adenosylmethionine decarboxylase proenzyme